MSGSGQHGRPYIRGLPIKYVGGRVICGKDDWGAAVNYGDPLPCCGCKSGAGASAPICDCRCHDTFRRFHQLPEASR